MREDMKHVIIDRPRKGGEGGKSRPPKGSLRLWQRTPVVDYPKRQSTARARLYGPRCKHLNEHLSPLRRWLRSNCGRPWSEVYSEICAGLSVRNATSAHVRDHAEQYVSQNTRLDGGVVCDSKGIPLNTPGWSWCLFYVDPRDGSLQEAPRRKYQRRLPNPRDFIEGADDLHQYRILNGIWYEIEFAPIGKASWVRDVLLGITIRKAENYDVYAKSKRQLGKQEIKKLALRKTTLAAAGR